MSRAQKLGIPAYISQAGRVFAGKITEMRPYDIPQSPGCSEIVLGEIGKRTIVPAKWIGENQPDIGGYLVLSDEGQSVTMRYEHPDFFEARHVAEPKA